jgi:hypothetical protein
MFRFLRHGLILLIFATMVIAIAGMASPGAAPDEGKSLVAAPTPLTMRSPGPCARDCLYGFVDKYFDAMISRCPCNIAMSPDVKYTEDGQLVKPGEGIWKTIAGRGAYRIYLADPATGQAGYYGDFSEDGGLLRGMVALRLKVQDHRITEVEVITVREQLRPKGGLSANTAGVMTSHMIDEMDPNSFIVPDSILIESPPAPEQRDRLVAATNRYFDGFTQSKGSLVPFDGQCARRENGMLATNNPDGPIVDPGNPTFRVFSQGCAQELDKGFFSALSKVRGVRQLIVDEGQGLVLTLSFFDNEGNVKSVSVPGVGNVVVPSDFLRPVTYMAPQLFKLEDGKIRQIEGLAWPVPLGMRSGWGE